MATIDVPLSEESRSRYLVYALSVVSSRALPDVRDGLKPVQRRILYAMSENLHLTPEKAHRKSAAVVGEVLARYHPHGDTACYEAMVRMAQDFSYRYPLVEGQGNFGSLDGDSAAAYRYTEARLTALAVEVIGDIGQETVSERDNFDQTVREPVVLPSRVPNLLVNGSSGIAVGMATAIPPHNLKEVVKAIKLLITDDRVTDGQLLSAIKGPDFPTGCLILNNKKELREIYSKGRGAICMRASHVIEQAGRGKERIVITAIPFAVNKATIVEKIADLIISKKVPQLDDVRDESTHEVRIVLELNAGAEPEKVLAYLFKHTPLQTNFNVNLTALIPTENPFTGRPAQLSLRQMLEHFIDFRMKVTRCKLQYEKSKLEERVHLLEGLIAIADVIDEVIKIVRKSDGRSDAASKLQARFKLTEVQALFIVDLRIYQLSRTSVEEIDAELKEKTKRIKEINKILKSDAELKQVIATDLQRISDTYGDERRCKIVEDVEEVEIEAKDFIERDDVFVIVSKDGWLKRIRNTNDPLGTRLREGDSIAFVHEASTLDQIALFTSLGTVFVMPVHEVSMTSGFGEPVQKIFRFQNEEKVIGATLLPHQAQQVEEFLLFTKNGMGLRFNTEGIGNTKKTGKKIAKVKGDDEFRGLVKADKPLLLLVSEGGYGVCFPFSEVPLLSGAGKGVILQKPGSGDFVVAGFAVTEKSKVTVKAQGGEREIDVAEVGSGSRAKKGVKVVKRGLPVTGV